ncbi:MAG: transcription elongation factor GreA [Clostridia bacterium]|nr:transcription elongation factor GreA [Clostridia bacterium]
MAQQQFILTEEGLKKYEEELEFLTTVKRKEISEKIKVALSFGDLSENSEYDEAKNDQAKLEARIAEIEVMLKNAKLVSDEDKKVGTVHIGSRVILQDIEYKENMEVMLVGSREANPDEGKLSDESPIGRAIIGKKQGAKVEVDAPAGKLQFKIVKIITEEKK